MVGWWLRRRLAAQPWGGGEDARLDAPRAPGNLAGDYHVRGARGADEEASEGGQSGVGRG